MAEEQIEERAAVQGFIKEQVETYFNELAQQQRQADPVVQKTQQDQAKDQLRDLINPFIEPALNEARFIAADSNDYAKFYTNNSDAIEYQDEVEKRFKLMKEAGRPTTRADILRHMVGDEFFKDKDRFVERLSEKKKQQLERAESASDFGYGSMTKAKNDPVFGRLADLSRLTGDDLSTALKELEKALDGVTL